jgi:ABC-type Fe3+-siderophore transport system permease subunit
MMIGAMLLVFCDLLVLWLEDWVQVPLNSVTALFGAPFVVWILVKRLT